jgi:hypothetical protein
MMEGRPSCNELAVRVSTDKSGQLALGKEAEPSGPLISHNIGYEA